MDENSAEDYVRSLVNPEVGKLNSLQEKLKRKDKEWSQQFVQAGGIEVLLSHLCLWSQYPDTFPVNEYRKRATLCSRCLFEIIVTSPRFFLDHSDYATRLIRCLDYSVTEVKKDIVKLFSTFCVHSAKGYRKVLSALHDYKTYCGLPHYLSAIVDEMRYIPFREYRALLLALINCIVTGQDFNGRVDIRNYLNELEFPDLLRSLDLDVLKSVDDVDTGLMQTQLTAFYTLEEKDEETEDNVFDDVDGSQVNCALTEEDMKEFRRLSVENIPVLNLLTRILLNQPDVINLTGTLPQVLQRFIKEQNAEHLVNDLVLNVTALDAGDGVDGRLTMPPPAPPLGSPPPSPLVGTSWVDNENAMSLYSSKPTRKMKRLQWTKVRPNLTDASKKSVWKEVLNLADSVAINEKALEENFALEEKSAEDWVTSKLSSASGIDLKPERRRVIDIALKSMKREVETIMKELREGGTEGIQAEHVRKIVNIMPSQQEINMIQDLKDQGKSQFREAERFFLLFDNFPICEDYQAYIRGILLMMELSETRKEMQQQMDVFTRGCEGLMNCEQMKSFLRLVLHTGNFLNHGVPVLGNALGFCISDLLKLSEIRSSKASGTPDQHPTPRATLLHHLIEETNQQNPEALEFIEKLRGYIRSVASVDFNELRKDVNNLKDRFDKLKGVKDKDGNGCFKDFCQEEKANVDELKEKLLAVENLHNAILEYFHVGKFNELLDSLEQFCTNSSAVLKSQQKMRSETGEKKQFVRRSLTSRRPGLNLDPTAATSMDEAFKSIESGSFKLKSAFERKNIKFAKTH